MPQDDKVYAISANKINMGLQCPFKLALYLMHIEPKEVDYSNTATGSAVHAFMEAMGNHTTHRDKYYIEGMYEKDPKRRQVVPASHIDKMKLCMANGKKWYGTLDYVSEQSFKVPLVTPKGRNVLLNGRIDAQTETELYDWKTSKSVKTDDYRRAAAIYDYATGFQKKIIYKSLFNGDEYQFPHASHDYVPALCDQYIDRLLAFDFPRKRQFLCKYCDYHDEYCFDGAETASIPSLIDIPREE